MVVFFQPAVCIITSSRWIMIDIYDGKALYDKIDAMREAKGWNINQLAQQAGVSAMALYHWRDRKSSPTLSLLDAVCTALGTNIINFLMDENDLAANKELLELWYRLTPEQQKSMLSLMRSM